LVHLEDVLFGRELERNAGDDEFDVGHVGNGVAVNGGGAADARNQVADALNLADDDFFGDVLSDHALRVVDDRLTRRAREVALEGSRANGDAVRVMVVVVATVRSGSRSRTGARTGTRARMRTGMRTRMRTRMRTGTRARFRTVAVVMVAVVMVAVVVIMTVVVVVASVAMQQFTSDGEVR